MENKLIDFDIIKPPKDTKKTFLCYERFNFKSNDSLIFVSGKYTLGEFNEMCVIDMEGCHYNMILAWKMDRFSTTFPRARNEMYVSSIR